ncbi:glycine cleavage system aminomethyltransferase GcvT, partial [Herbaspirillum sp. WGmk3]|nr:glycine cleavage system aminomethyltransferase GcvT [Herbaspirillum sp. WGmk3]
LMVANKGDHLLLVVNAACAEADVAHMTAAGLGPEVVTDRALLALQGPAAEAALAALVPGAAELRFMDAADLPWDGGTLWVSRS